MADRANADRRSFESRIVAQREALRVSPDELLERIEASPYGEASKMTLRQSVEVESLGQVGFGTFDVPPVAVRGQGAKIWDADGREFIDMLAGFGVANVGHSRPEVVRAIQEQADSLVHYFDFPHPGRELLASRLVAITPGDHAKRVAFSTTGADAVDIAMKAARWYTGAPMIVSAYGAYHGVTSGTMATTGKGRLRAYFYPTPPHDSNHAKIPYSYPYRCPVGASPENCADACLDFFRRMLAGKESPLNDNRGGISNVAAVMLEPMQASAGYIVPGDGYLAGMREICDEFGMLLIADEIQSGMGRTGRMWACDHEGVVPDIVTISKSLGSGVPISAVVLPDEVGRSWGAGAHIGTFAATPLATAAANATLDVFENDDLVGKAAETGDYFRERLEELQERHPILGWIDAKGLFIGLEFVRDRATKEPAIEETDWMLEYCVQEGLLLERGGYLYNRFQLIPPLVITHDEIDRAVGILDGAMTLAEKRSGLVNTATP